MSQAVDPPFDLLLATAESVAAERPDVDLVSPDPGAAVRARSRAVLETPEGAHDPKGVAASLSVSATILQL